MGPRLGSRAPFFDEKTACVGVCGATRPIFFVFFSQKGDLYVGDLYYWPPAEDL